MTVLEADDGVLGRPEKFPDRFASVSVAQEQMDIELLGLNWEVSPSQFLGCHDRTPYVAPLVRGAGDTNADATRTDDVIA